jgi:ABC-2 type transport system permease protein
MIAAVARKEFLEMLRSGRFRWAAAAVLALLAASAGVGWRHHTAVVARQPTAERMEWERWLNKGAMHPHMAAHYGLYVYRPQSALSTLDSGINAYTGLTSHLGAEERKMFQFKPAQDGVTVQRIGELTAAATLQHLVPLLIIVVLFSSFVGEREQGTLRQVLSLGISRRRLAAGKVLGTVVPLLVFLAVPSLLGVIALWLNSEGAEFARAAPRLVGWLSAIWRTSLYSWACRW